MLRALLRDGEAAKALFEKAGLFKTPEQLEKYVIAGEVTVEVLDSFLSHILGTERTSIDAGSADMKAICGSLCRLSLSDRKDTAEELPNKEVEDLRVKVQDLERQLCAVQRQIQMQGEVSHLAASLDDKLESVVRECQRQISETGEALRSDVKSRVEAVSGGVARLEREVGHKAHSEDMKALSEEVAKLKKTLRDSVFDLEKKVAQKQNDKKEDIKKARWSCDDKKKSLRDKKDGKKKDDPPVTYQIHIRCDNGENLVAADKGGVSDPYIVFRVEGSSQKVMNQCVENTVNPVWGDVVQVDGYAPGNDLLKITVMDRDKRWGSKNDDPIGYAELEVRDIQPFGQTVQKRIPLREVDKKGKPWKKSQPGDAGYINLTFHVHHEGTAPFTDEAWEFSLYNLRVKCVKAEDVPAKDLTGKSDPFLRCKIKDVPNSQKKKTKTDKQTLNPYWNEELYFKLNDPKTDVLKVTMLDEDKLSKPDKMSKIMLPLSEYPINQWVRIEKDMTPIGSCTHGGLLFLELMVEAPV